LMTADLGFQTGEEGETISPISPITLAALADLGYRVNLDKSTPGWGLLGGQQFNPDNLTKEQIKAFRQLTEESFAQPDDEFIYAIMSEVDPAKVSPEIWAHAERAPNGEYYDWVKYKVSIPNDSFWNVAERTMGNGIYWEWIANRNGVYDPPYWLYLGDTIEIPKHHPNYEWKQEQERKRREEELRKKQEEEARKRREEEERLAREKAEQERKRREEEERRKEAEAKQRELEEQERRLREEQERKRQQEEYEREQARLRELERQREIARQKGKGGQDWFFATRLPEFGPTDPFETSLTGETVGNLVPDDYYRFNLSRKGRVTAELRQLLADADLVLYDVRNNPIAWSMRDGITDEHIIADLIPGTYMLRVNSPKGVTTDYDLIVKFQHLLSRTQTQPLPPGWRPGGGGGGGSGAASPLFSDPRIQRIYDTALANFAGPERAKANAKIAELQREKRSYEQEMKALLDKMNDEQRKKVHKALDDARNHARTWVDDIANPIKNSVDSLGKGIKNKADSLASSLLSKIDNIWDLGNGWIKARKEDARKLVRQGRDAVKTAVNNAQSWLKGQLTNIQNNVKSAISTFFNTIKNAYRTGGEINQIIANAANAFRRAIDRAVRGANELVGKFKGRVLSAVEWTKNLGININKFGVKFEFNAYNQVVKPAVNAIARGVSSTINGIGNSLKGITNWLEPRTQDAVAKIVNAILGDKTGHLWNKIHGVDAKIAATRTGVEKVIQDQGDLYKRLLDDFLYDLGKGGKVVLDFSLNVLLGEFSEAAGLDEPNIWHALTESSLLLILEISFPIAGSVLSGVADLRDLIAYGVKFANHPKEMQDPWNWVGVASAIFGLIPYIGNVAKPLGKLGKKAGKFSPEIVDSIRKIGLPIKSNILNWLKNVDINLFKKEAVIYFQSIIEKMKNILENLVKGAKKLKTIADRIGGSLKDAKNHLDRIEKWAADKIYDLTNVSEETAEKLVGGIEDILLILTEELFSIKEDEANQETEDENSEKQNLTAEPGLP